MLVVEIIREKVKSEREGKGTMEIHERLQNYAVEFKDRQLQKRNVIEKGPPPSQERKRKGLPKEGRIVPFLQKDSETVFVMIDYLKHLNDGWRAKFFDNEISESFEKRCDWAREENHQHKHDYVEAFYLAKGSAVQNIGKKSYQVREGDFWIMNTSVAHSIVLREPEALIMNILISEKCYQRAVSQVVDAKNPLYHFLMNEIYEDEKRPEFLCYRISEDILEEDLYRLLLEEEAERPFMQQLKENILTNIFLQLSRMKLLQAERCKRKKRSLDIFQVMDYISQNYNHVTLNDLAQQFYYSPAYLSRFLREQTGLNFRQMICKMKMEKAREMLANTDWTIEQISESMNYTNRKHFEKSFVELFGQTPSQYRKGLGDMV